MRTYYTSIDFLRGVAALLVAFFHFTHHQSIHGTLLSEDDWIYKIGHFGQYGVHLFFVISGFVIPYSMVKHNYTIPKIGKFLLKRITRIEPPYLLSMLWVLLSGIGFAVYLGNDIVLEWKRIALHLGYFIPFSEEHWFNDVYWTLAIEFQYYLLIAFTFPLFFHQKDLIRTIALGSMALFPFLGYDGFLVAYTPIFGMGIVGALVQLNKITKASFFFWVVVFFGAILFFKGGIIAGICLLTLFIIVGMHIKTKSSDFLGKISYSVYLTHGELGGKFIYFLLPFCPTSSIQSYLLLIGAILFSIFGAWIFYLVVEAPSKRLASKIKL
ncbi:MAG: acyltransferase [Flavobacteriales bacterium]|jgi:peptidoglycan/LPS O-acetylase OafA/YrhL|nr:acyltransferase [Flavobacteriales bacterium]